MSTRDYLAVRVETDAGVFGDALGYSRGTPLITALSRVGQNLLGSNPLLRRQGLHAFCVANTIPDSLTSELLACWT